MKYEEMFISDDLNIVCVVLDILNIEYTYNSSKVITLIKFKDILILYPYIKNYIIEYTFDFHSWYNLDSLDDLDKIIDRELEFTIFTCVKYSPFEEHFIGTRFKIFPKLD